ncbi:hypothetical protein [Helicobacter mesocricetorum]|uniref:hypothetical protein n=1 Tax=Helicobacter mesocricetorum TaxID=87012 RepID=UPI000CF15853|nr:hypothetical protein [Helicobacter mesocricetorum]
MNFYENDFREFFNKHDVDTEAFVAKIEELFPLFKSMAEQMGFDISINDDLEEVLCHLRDVYSYGIRVILLSLKSVQKIVTTRKLLRQSIIAVL